MTTRFARLLLVVLACAPPAGALRVLAQAKEGTPFRIERLDPALDAIVAPSATLETLGDRFALTEGPVWVGEGPDGYLLFSDNAANVIYKWAPGQPLSVFLERSGFTGTDNSNVGAQTVAGRVPILLIGSNGLALDPQGRLVVTAMNDRTVYRLENDGTRGRSWPTATRASASTAPTTSSIKSNGAVYFTDSVWGLRGAANDPARELPYSGFFLIKDGKVTLLGGDKDSPGTFPNGITLSPDERYLYVTAGGRRTMRYDVLPDDTVANGRLFVDHGTDGMRVDTRGNLYTTSGGTPGVIQITSPEGKPLGRLHLPQPAVRAASARVRHERRVRRRRQPRPVHHRVHAPLQAAPEPAWRATGAPRWLTFTTQRAAAGLQTGPSAGRASL